VLETIEPGVHIVKTPTQPSFDRGTRLEKLLKSRFHEHTFSDAWPVRCDVKPTTDTLAQPNRHLPARGSFALASGSDVNAVRLRIKSGELLHWRSP